MLGLSKGTKSILLQELLWGLLLGLWRAHWSRKA